MQYGRRERPECSCTVSGLALTRRTASIQLLQPSQRFQPRPLELITFVPLGCFVRIGDAQPDPKCQACLLRKSCEIPVRAVFIGGLMVAMLVVIGELFIAPTVCM